MKRLGIILTLLGVIISVNVTDAQEQIDPDEQIIVNKKFDDNGNLIQYDSTYVHKWSSDSTFDFTFPDGDYFAGKGMKNIEDFFEQFFNDSVTAGIQIPYHLNPFFNDDLFNQFELHFNDSIFDKNFGLYDPFYNHLRKDSLSQVHPGFGFTNPDELRKLMDEQLRHFYDDNFEFHKFDNQKQTDEWGKLMDKHQQEIEAFRKKWENTDPNP